MKHNKYRQYPIVENFNRTWPNNAITKAPIYCSVDLRDGNQALVSPLNIEQKVEYFSTLVGMGFKHIEASYPSASQTDFDFTRKIIEEGLVPDDVYLQVLIPARDELIDRSVMAMRGVKKGIFHLYNPTAKFQREVVFKKSDDEIIAMAVEGMKTLIEKTKDFQGEVVYEYTPESFSQTDLEFAVEICNEVIKVVDPTPKNKMIINLPNTLEACTPNIYADRVEWMCSHLYNRENIIVSVHPHNDRGTAVASAEMAILAGADRVEGTLFGNGERAGNLDLVTMAFNIYSQGIDPKLDLSHIDEIKDFVEKVTDIKTHIRHPYVGDMIFTAFSGGHQDAIKKGIDFHRQNGSKVWDVPYLPIDPADIKRGYDKVVRINSQSGKGGAAFIIAEFFGKEMTKDEAIKFGQIVKEESDKKGKELTKEEIIKLYQVTKEVNSWDADNYKNHASFENQFDGVFSNAVLHWIKDSEIVIKNVNKALKKGGRFVAEFGGNTNAKNIVDGMKEAFKRNPDFGEFKDPWYFPTTQEYKEILEVNGFTVEYIELIPRPTPMDDMINWLDIFANGLVEHLNDVQKEKFKQDAVKIMKAKLYTKEKGWMLDYVRLRVKAVKV